MPDLARHLDPATGDLAFDPVAGSWAESAAPAMEAVALVLATPRGSCLLDPTLGVDWDRIQKGTPGAAALCRAALLDALRPLARDGTINDLAVTVDVPAPNVLHYVVTYADPRAPGAPRAHRGQV